MIQEWETENIKIGYSEDPEERLKQFQTGNPRDLEVMCEFECPRSTESHFHKIFKPFHIRGEWYDRRVERFFLVNTRCVDDLYDNYAAFEEYMNGNDPSYSVTVLERIIEVL
jgi:hypothetical protein